MVFNIYHNLVIKASAKEVFDAITLPQHLNNWWTLKSSGKPEINTQYNLNFTDFYDWYATVFKVIPNQCFHLKMQQADADWNSTTFGFDLEPHEHGVLVKFSHVNWLDDNNHFKHSSFCWALLLNGLKNYLEQNIIIPFEARS